MTYLNSLYVRFRRIKKRESGKLGIAFKAELIKINNRRIRLVSVLISLLYIIFIFTTDIPNFQKGLWSESNGYQLVFAGHISYIIFTISAYIISNLIIGCKRKFNQSLVLSLQRIEYMASLLLLLMVTSGIYIVNNNFQSYIGVILGFSILLFMTDIFSLIFFSSGFVLAFIVIKLFTLNSSNLESILMDVITFSLFSFLFSRINYYRQLKNFHIRMIILEQKDRLNNLASIDQLTKVYNRRKFNDLIAFEIDRAERYENIFSIIMFDIDFFKQVNDNFGHHAGDYVLREICLIVKKHLRNTDSIVRWGGEEFVIIASETTLARAELLAEKLRVLISGHYFSGIGNITASFGITEYISSETVDSIMMRVDSALYCAKKRGRNLIVSE